MAKRILVPLEETVQAESMIEAVAALSRGTGALVRLLHVAPTPQAVFDEDGRVLATRTRRRRGSRRRHWTICARWRSRSTASRSSAG